MLRIALLTLGLGIVLFAVERQFAPAWLAREWRLILGFLLSVSFLTWRLQVAGRSADAAQQVTFSLAGTVLRLVLAFGFVGVVLYRGVANPAVFALNFLVLYICYVGFEIGANGRNLRRDS
jgi:hypothetical protein